jgi:hypothetical protein
MSTCPHVRGCVHGHGHGHVDIWAYGRVDIYGHVKLFSAAIIIAIDKKSPKKPANVFNT